LSLEKKQQSTFKVGGGDGEVTEGETIRRRTMDNDKDEKKHNNQIMRGCDGNGDSNDHDNDDDDDVANSDDDDCHNNNDDDGSGNGDGGGVGDSDGGATDNNQLTLQKRRRLQLGNGWATALQRQRQG